MARERDWPRLDAYLAGCAAHARARVLEIIVERKQRSLKEPLADD